MSYHDRQIRAKVALNWLTNTGCLELLLKGKNLETNDHAHIGGARGRNIAKQVRDNVNELLTQYAGGLARVPAAEIDFNSGEVRIKPEYQERFAQAVQNYRGGDNDR